MISHHNKNYQRNDKKRFVMINYMHGTGLSLSVSGCTSGDEENTKNYQQSSQSSSFTAPVVHQVAVMAVTKLAPCVKEQATVELV